MPGETALGERLDGLFAAQCRQLVQRLAGDVQVVVAPVLLTLGADHVTPRRAARSRPGLDHALDLDHTSALELVEVTADGGGRVAEQLAEFGGADGTVLQHGGPDLVPRPVLGLDQGASRGRTG